MAKIDRTAFFAYARRAPFGNRLSQQQVDGLTAILDVWDAHYAAEDIRWLAYIIATAFHETGGRMAPVREGFAKSDAAARKMFADKPYGSVNPISKQVYYGRGLVQLTWSENYRKMERVVGLPLFNEPDLALHLDVEAAILVHGMVRGDFTGKSVRAYFTKTVDDPIGARKVINGADKASLIASYHERLYAALQAGHPSTETPADVMEAAAEPDKPSLTTDKTVWGTVTGIVGAGGAGLLQSVDNPWALAAVVLAGIGVILFLTGRLEIRRKAGA